MTVTFADLTDKQQCIYDSFGKATGQPGAYLGGIVNGKGVDANDTEAVLILAEKYNFTRTPRGCTGAKFKSVLSNLEEDTEFIVLVCMGMGRSMVPKSGTFAGGSSYDFERGFDARPMFTSAAFDEILWHAIHVKGGAGKAAVTTDRQGLRPTGPVSGDRVIWFAR